MGHPILLPSGGDHPSVPVGRFEVPVRPVSGLHGTQSCSINVMSLRLGQPECSGAGGCTLTKGWVGGQAACFHLLGCLPGKVWIQLVWLLLRCLTVHLRGRLLEDPARPGFHGERLLVEEGAVWQTVQPWKYR